MTAAHRGFFTSGAQSFERVFASQFQEEEPAVCIAPEEILLDQGLKAVEIRLTDRFCGLELEAAGEPPRRRKSVCSGSGSRS